MRNIFPYAMELEQMEKDDPEMLETYRELMCHFYICKDVHNNRGNANRIKVLADYLFPILDGAPEDTSSPSLKRIFVRRWSLSL